MLALGVLGNCLFAFLPGVQKSKNEVKDIPKLSNMIKLFKIKEIRPLLCLMSLTGVVTAFYSGFLSSLINSSLSEEVKADKNLKNQAISAIYIVLGGAEVFAGLIIGIVSDKFNLYTLITIGTLIVESALILSLISSFYKSYLMCFFLGLLWGMKYYILIIIGFTDCYFCALLQNICNQDYSKKIEIFGIFKLV